MALVWFSELAKKNLAVGVVLPKVRKMGTNPVFASFHTVT